MKNLDTLNLLVGQLTKLEIKQFRKYGIYKQKKNVLKLFELILRNKDEDTTEKLQIDIKRNKLTKNLRYSVDALYDLLLNFWDDNPQDDDWFRNINKLINQSNILYKKGLIKESVKLLKKAEKAAENVPSFELKLFAKNKAFSTQMLLKPKKSIQLGDAFLEQQLETLDQLSHAYEAKSIYCQGHHLMSKGMLMLDKNERKQLIEIRSKAEVLINSSNLSVWGFLQLGDLLSLLYQTVTPSNLQRAEQYYLNNINRFKKDPKASPNIRSLVFHTQVYNYLVFLYFNKRLEDYKTYHKLLLEAQTLSSSIDGALNLGLRHTTSLMLCLLEYDPEKTKTVLHESWAYYKENDDKTSLISRWKLLFCCFQLAFAIGDYEQAALCADKLNASEMANNEMKQYKLLARLASLLLHYENDNQEYVLNQVSAVRRLYSSHLKKHIGGDLLLKLLKRLSNSHNKKEKSILLNNFLKELKAVFDQYPEHQALFGFTIIEDWVGATLNGSHTIFDYKN